MPSLHDFATWQPLLRLLHAAHAETLTAPGGHVAGQISTGAWSVPLPFRPPRPGRASQVSDNQEQFDAVGRIVEALEEDGSDRVSFVMEASSAPDDVRLHLIGPGPSAEPGVATAHPGTLLLVDGALPEPVRRLPDPVPGAVPAPSASLALVFGLPRLRTLSTCPGTFADPREIARLTHLEYLELPPAEWRVLLDAGAVPTGLLAAGIEAHRQRDNPLETTDLANEILTLYGRPPITGITVLEGAACTGN
ncbi:hypothetical protein ACH5A7_19745 [Streptomyces sp. NPDC018955]|uniref:hypothetical protein n=1 Tax=Streptomyces sp. NPDC018955 TaxID=3365055 RepID=UPI0037AEE91D